MTQSQLTVREALISALNLEGCESAEREALVQEFTEVVVNTTLTDLVERMEPAEIEEIEEWLKGTSPDDAVALRHKFGSNIEDFLAIFNKNLHDIIREFEHDSKQRISS